MKSIIVYYSKTGFTKRYADWIAEELHCDVIPYKDFMKGAVDVNTTVIFGSRVHAGRIQHLNNVKSRMGDNLIVFATGATPTSAENVIQKIWVANLTGAEFNSIPHFYMPGGLDYSKMGFSDRIIMKIVAKLMKGKKGKTEDETGFGQAVQDSYDISSMDYIEPLVSFVKAKESSI